MRDKPLRWIATAGVAAGLFVGVLATVGYQSLSTEALATDARHAVAPITSNAELTAALRELNEVLSALDARLQQSQLVDASAAQREPVTNADAESSLVTTHEDPVLARALTEIATALRELRADGAGLDRKQAELVVPDWLDRSTAFDSTAMRTSYLADDGLAQEATEDAFLRKHLLWSKQDVLSAYGKPDNIYVNESGSTWYWELAVPGGREEFTFRFHDGAVYSFKYDYDEVE